MTIEYDLLTDADKQALEDAADDQFFLQLKAQQERHYVVAQEIAVLDAQLAAMPDEASLQDAKNAKLEKMGNLEAGIRKLMLIEPNPERKAAALTRLGLTQEESLT